MTLPRQFHRFKFALWRGFLLAFLVAGFCSISRAQVLPVTAWTTTGIIDNTDSVSGGITFYNKYETISSFTAGGETYSLTLSGNTSIADHAYVRRSTATPTATANINALHIMTVSGSSGTTVQGQYYPTAENLLLSGNILTTIADAFTNTGSGSSVLVSNVERLDFVWSSGYLANPTDVIAVFNVDAATTQDDFRIAIFTSIDGSNTPTAYVSTGLVINTIPPASSGGDGTDTGTGADYGDKLAAQYPTGTTGTASTTTSLSNWRIAGYSNGDNLSGAVYAGFSSTNQGIGGAAIRLSDLGITTSQVIYGYSLMGPDVSPTLASDLVSWTNSSVFLTTTTDSQGTADFTTFTGRFIKPVPEPSTYGAILMGVGLAAYALRRRLGRR